MATIDQTDAHYLDAVIVGAGFAGVYLLRELRKLRFRVKLIEAGAALGGVWHSNTYPGARVDSDIPAYEFSNPEIWTDWNWSERFPSGPDLRRYFEHVDRCWDISRDVLFQTRVTQARFDESERAWLISTNKGTELRTRFLLPCTGFASKAFFPKIPGLQAFKGPCVHTAHWPQSGVDFAGKHVAVIGTGASGVQVVQEATRVASSVTVLQRTPILALPMQQKKLTVDQQRIEKQDYPARFARRLETFGGLGFDFLPEAAFEVTASQRQSIYESLWNQGGFHFWLGTFRDVLFDDKANRTAYDFWRDQTRARIRDRQTAELLAPTEPPHPYGVKRPSLEQNYFDCFNEDHVRVVDLRRTPIDEVRANGLGVDGRLIEADVIVLATGFDAVTGGLVQMDIRGVDGRRLGDAWANGVRTHLGVSVHGFPNLLMSYGPQSPSGFSNGPTSAEVQGEWLGRLLTALRGAGHTRIEATANAESEWNALVESIANMSLFPKADSWYMGANVPGKTRQILMYPGGIPDYITRINAVLERDFSGFTVQ